MAAGRNQHRTLLPSARRIAVAILLTATAWQTVAAADFDHTHLAFTEILEAHVKNGRVDYRALKAKPGALKQYLDSLARVPRRRFGKWQEKQRLAFLFNLYNAATLQLIVDHYPVAGIKKIGGWLKSPWDLSVVRVFGGRISLNRLEHKILRQEYNEPRLHLALVCAAGGCPPLRREAFTAETLDKQLDEQARAYLGSAKGLRIDRRAGVVYVSSIFKWYGGDFVDKHTPKTGFSGLGKTERAVAAFCAAYVPEKDRSFLRAGGYHVKYLRYDWSLNKQTADAGSAGEHRKEPE